MFKWLFGKRCEHDFKVIDTLYDTYYDYDVDKYKIWRRYVLYCPKCEKEKRVNADRHDLEIKKRKIKSKYIRN